MAERSVKVVPPISPSLKASAIVARRIVMVLVMEGPSRRDSSAAGEGAPVRCAAMAPIAHPNPPTSPATGPLYRAWVLFILVVVYTFNFVDRVIVGILAEPIKRDLSLTDTQLGLMSGAAFALFYTCLGIPIARLADRTSRTWIMTAALAVWSGFTALCGQALTFTQLLLARVGVGVGEAGGVAPAFSLISDYFPPAQRARALAVFSFGVPIGSGLGMLFGGLVASAVDWRVAFLSVGLGGLVLAPILRLTVREPARGALDAQGAAPAHRRRRRRAIRSWTCAARSPARPRSSCSRSAPRAPRSSVTGSFSGCHPFSCAATA